MLGLPETKFSILSINWSDKICIASMLAQDTWGVKIKFGFLIILKNGWSFGIGSLSWLLKTYLTRTWSEIRGTRVGIAILAFCLAYIISLTTAVDLENSIEYMKKLLQVIIFFWVANTVQDEKQRNILVSLVIFAAVASALHGIYFELIKLLL